MAWKFVGVQERKKNRPNIEQVKEEYLRWTSAEQEEVDELWKEVASRMKKKVLNTLRGGQLHWIEEKVMEKNTKTKGWRRAQALAMKRSTCCR